MVRGFFVFVFFFKYSLSIQQIFAEHLLNAWDLPMHHIGQRLRLPHSDGGGGEQAVLETTENSSRAYEVFFLVGLINWIVRREFKHSVKFTTRAQYCIVFTILYCI